MQHCDQASGAANTTTHQLHLVWQALYCVKAPADIFTTAIHTVVAGSFQCCLFAPDLVGAELREGLRAVSSLQDECLAHSSLGQALLQVPALTRKDEGRVGLDLAAGLGHLLLVCRRRLNVVMLLFWAVGQAGQEQGREVRSRGGAAAGAAMA